jgi:hypothetical protein
LGFQRVVAFPTARSKGGRKTNLKEGVLLSRSLPYGREREQEKHYVILHYTTLYYTILYYTILYCTIINFTALELNRNKISKKNNNNYYIHIKNYLPFFSFLISPALFHTYFRCDAYSLPPSFRAGVAC